jgi:hypothetical protein
VKAWLDCKYIPPHRQENVDNKELREREEEEGSFEETQGRSSSEDPMCYQ